MIQSTNQKPFFGVNQSTQINGELTIKKQKNIKLRECLFTSKFHEFKSCIYVTINQRLHGWSTRGSQRCRPRWRLNISLQNQSLGGFLHLDIIKHTRFTQKDTLCWSRHKSGHFAFQQHSNIITADLFVLSLWSIRWLKWAKYNGCTDQHEKRGSSEATPLRRNKPSSVVIKSIFCHLCFSFF